MADEQTSNRGYPIPVAENWLSDDVSVLRAAFVAIDLDVAAILTTLGLKASVVHGHGIGDINGLQTALDSKAALGHNHDFASLNGVSVSGAPDGYVLAKQGSVWVPQSPGALLGPHSHGVGDITGLQATLDGKLSEASLATAASKAAPVDADTLALSDSAASGGLKRLSWSNVKAALKTYFDGLYQAAGSYAAAIHSHAVATASAAGFMSAGDKAKLDGLSTGSGYKRTLYTSSATWSKPEGLVKVIVTAVGGGGGSGGRSGTMDAARGGAGSSGAASQSEILAENLAATEAITVGPGGTAGTSGSNNAGNGEPSSFGAHCVAPGGLRGNRDNGNADWGGGASPPAAGVGNLFAIPGMGGKDPSATGFSATHSTIATGTHPLIGPSDVPAAASSGTVGNPGRPNSGQGASGGYDLSTNGRAGAAGGSGYVIVEEFF